MENIVKQLLAQQIKEKKIPLRRIHAQIEKLCEENSSYTWISLSTLERRLQRPLDMTDSEADLIREAVQKTISEATWTHIKRNITEKMRYSYAQKIDAAISHGFALEKQIEDYNNDGDDPDYFMNVLTFYRSAPQIIKQWWLSNLDSYLKLPSLAKAAILCSSYIGESVKKRADNNKKIKDFLDFFPFYQGINSISDLEDDFLLILSNTMKTASCVLKSDAIPGQFLNYAINTESINIKSDNSIAPKDEFEYQFCNLASEYKKRVVDYKVKDKDFIHECCFILFVDKVEWLLAFATCIFFYKIKSEEERYNMRREYHERGCTGFKFTDKELDYLCDLLYVIQN